MNRIITTNIIIMTASNTKITTITPMIKGALFGEDLGSVTS
jgi:hypothetical protein